MLATERLILRDVREADVEFLLAYHADSAYLSHYVTRPDAHEIVASAINWATEEPRTNFQFAVVLASADTVIGCAGLRQQGWPPGEAEVGVEISPHCWRRGYAREALRSLIDFGTSRLSIQVFWGCTARSNRPAQALAVGLGFQEFAETNDTIRMRFQADG